MLVTKYPPPVWNPPILPAGGNPPLKLLAENLLIVRSAFPFLNYIKQGQSLLSKVWMKPAIGY